MEQISIYQMWDLYFGGLRNKNWEIRKWFGEILKDNQMILSVKELDLWKKKWFGVWYKQDKVKWFVNSSFCVFWNCWSLDQNEVWMELFCLYILLMFFSHLLILLNKKTSKKFCNYFRILRFSFLSQYLEILIFWLWKEIKEPDVH